MGSNDVQLILILLAIILGSGFIFYIIVGGFNKKTPPPAIEPYQPPKKMEEKKQEVNEKQHHLFPLTLQAYEQIVLFIERIEPSNLVMKYKTNDQTAQQLHGILLHKIREEYEQTVTQQIYVSDNAWNLTKQAKEETINIINMAATSLEQNGSNNDLTRSVFEKMMLLPKSPSQIALDYLKAEIKEIIK